jgi:hypothetical protein
VTVAERLAEIFPGETIAFVDRIDAMADRFDRLVDQRPSTCGAFALSYLLPVLGYARHDGHDLAAEDYLAHLAAVVIEGREVAPSDEVSTRVARGELSEAEALERYGRTWYRYPVRASDDPVAQGTSPTGIARAVAVATDGRLATLPIAGRLPDGRPQLTPARSEALLELLATHLAGWRLHAVLNYEADQALKPDSPAYTPANLRASDVLERIPRDDWGVGHFAGLAGLWRRPDGGWWLVLLDTYKRRGFDGYQPQPAELVRRALVREDGRGGGILVVVPREHLDAAAASIESLGLRLGAWSNGSPDPDDWS